MLSTRAARFTLAFLAALACPLTGAQAAAPPAQLSSSAPWSGLAHVSFRHQTDIALGVGTGLAQDRQGFIWLSTQTGLVRWDGLRMRRYMADPGRPNALPDSYTQCVKVDQRGRLWIGTSSGGLARYDPVHDSFVTIGAGPQGLSHTRVSALEDDGAGGIWIGTGGGLEHIDAAGRVHAATSGAPQIGAAQLPQGGVDALLRDRSAGLWIGTRRGLLHRTDDTAPALSVPLRPGATEPGVNAIYQDGRGRVWIGTRTHGAFVIGAPGTAPHPVLGSDGKPALEGERVFSIVEKSPDVIWLGTEGGGILEVDLAQSRTRRIRHHPDAPDSLVDDDAVAMFRERGGQIFVATAEALSVADPRPQGFITVRSTQVGGNGKLSAPSVLARPDGRVWLAQSGGSISIVDPLVGEVGAIVARADIGHGGLPKGRILAMVDGPDGQVYIGTQQGVFRSRADGSDVQRVLVPSRPLDAAAWALAWRDGVLWVGGLDGIWAVALAPSAPPILLRHEDAALGDSRVTAILPLADGSAWVGTRAGLARLHARTGPVELLPTDAADRTRLPPGYVAALVLDHQQRLWVSTFSSGAALLERTDADGRRRFRRIGMAEGMPDNGVNVLVPAANGTLWLSTDNGLASIDPVSLAVHAYGAGDGVHVPTYWTGAAARMGNGDILFGGLSGITVVRPGLERSAPTRAPVAVTRIELAGRDIPSAPFNEAHGGAVLTLAPDDRARGFSLDYTALDFAPPGQDRYAYRLAGFDRDWIDTDGALRRVSYNNLPPGEYTLQLRASAGGVASVQDVPVRVLPAWHQQRWVHVLAALLLVGLLMMLVQARTRLLRRRQRELEAMVAERTAELRATQSRLETMVYADPLTGLPNRRLFNDEMRRMSAQAQRGGAPFSLLLIDLDHFKTINDTLGHDAGDALLVVAAQRLLDAVRAGERVVRLGGDEFAVLLEPGTDAGAIGSICERIVDSLARPILHGAHTMQISASVGGATFDATEPGVDALYKQADLALYRAKKAGRNTWRFGTQRFGTSD